MFGQYYTPSANLHNDDLDHFLLKGWFRSGQSINTSTILNFKSRLYSPVRVRLPLKNYKFKKNLKKLWNKNKGFETVCRPILLNEEKENLYSYFENKYIKEVPPTLKKYLFDGKDNNIYNTYEVAVYNDNKELIAASFFDLGEKCMASILGIYNPNYQKYSPGIYTMLAEIQFGIDNGFEYYFPGYITPGYSKFDYKLRIGNLEYYEPLKDSWHSYEQMQEEALPSNIIENKLMEVSHLLKEKQIEHKLYYYPFMNKGFKLQNSEVVELDSPLFIHLLMQTNNLALTYSYETGDFEVSIYLGFEFSVIDYPVYFSHKDYPTFYNTLLKTNVVIKNSDIGIVIKKLKTLNRLKVK